MEQLTFKTLREAIFGSFKLIFYEFPLDKSNHGWENPHQVYSERYRHEDAYLLEEVIENMDIDAQFTMKEVDERIKDGHIFYVAKQNGKIIGYCWYLINIVKIPEFDITLHMKPDEVCSVNSYIQPEHRGKGIRNYMRAYEYNELIKKGYRCSLTFVNENNKASLRMHQKWGSVKIGVAKRFNILTLTFHYADIKTNQIIFHSGPFALWKKLYHRIKKCKFK